MNIITAIFFGLFFTGIGQVIYRSKLNLLGINIRSIYKQWNNNLGIDIFLFIFGFIVYYIFENKCITVNNNASYTESVNKIIGEEYKGYQSILTKPGSVVGNIKLNLCINAPIRNYKIYLTSPSSKRIEWDENNFTTEFEGVGLNGTWILEVKPLLGKTSKAILKSWTLSFENINTINLIEKHGQCQTFIESNQPINYFTLDVKGNIFYDSDNYIFRFNEDGSKDLLSEVCCNGSFSFDNDERLFIPTNENITVLLPPDYNMFKTILQGIVYNPIGAKIDPNDSNILYIAEKNRVIKYNIDSGDWTILDINGKIEFTDSNLLLIYGDKDIKVMNLNNDLQIFIGKIIKPGHIETVYNYENTCAKFDNKNRLWICNNNNIKIIEPCGNICDINYTGDNVGTITDMEIIKIDEDEYDLLICDGSIKVIKGIIFVSFLKPIDKYCDLKIEKLGRSVIKDGKLGFTSYIKNYGNANAPSDIVGCLDIVFILTNLNGNIINTAIKSPAILSSNINGNDLLSGASEASGLIPESLQEMNFKFINTENIASIMPGKMDITSAEDNAILDISNIQDDTYIYTMHVDPQNTYGFQNDRIDPYSLTIKLSTDNNNKRIVTII